MSDYPNREHENADKAAKRRASKALTDIAYEVNILGRRLEAGTVDGGDTNILSDRVRQLTQHLSTLAALREVREWHAIDQAEA